MPALSEMIAGLFERAARSGQPEIGTAARGLQLKGRIVEGQRQLLLSRPDVPPSDLEVTTCAKHGGFGAYEVRSGPLWQLIVEARDLCDHTPGFSGSGDSKAEYFYFGSCASCQALWQRILPRRGSGETFTYNGQPVSPDQFKLLIKRGPKGELTNETADERKMREFMGEAVGKAATTAPPFTVSTCGSCANGTATAYPNEVECQLGWEAHEQVRRLAVWFQVPQGHGGLPLPILHPDHHCVAVLGQGHPSWTARA